jgi:hypothetical protein
MIEPVQEIQNQQRAKFANQNSDFAIVKRRLEELEFTFQKVQRQSLVFDELKTNQDKFQIDLRNQMVSMRSDNAVHIARINE